MHWKDAWNVLKVAALQWYNDNPFRLGAALAYYAVFSIGPIVLIAVTIAGMVFGKEEAREQLVSRINQTAGPQVGEAIGGTLRYAHQAGGGVLATVIGVVVLLVAAAGLFAAIQDALNTIWGVRPKSGRGIAGVVKDRLLPYLMVLGVGVLLLASLVLSSVLAAVSHFLPPSSVPGGLVLWRVLNWAVSLVLLTALFALVYKVLPDVEIGWGDVWVGAAVTAVLFTAGTYLIGLYLGRGSVASPYGAAGSLVVILVWVYYSSQIFLFGAEFTQAYANRAGRPMQPAENAVRVGQAAG
ncbi:MAG TPA: YihY/virulence factor BrkB family protein [Gemmataceae bacterium]|nr:YihY/virulence factor BrkB family protein [Gemmataceae bacterium]